MKKLLNWVRTHKKIALVALLFISFGGSAGAYAWWNSLEVEDNITIGVGDGVSIQIDLNEETVEGKLVPTGKVVLSSQVDEVIFNYVVEVIGENISTGSAIHLQITHGALSLDTIDSTSLENIFTIELEVDETSVGFGKPVTITEAGNYNVQIRITMSDNPELYENVLVEEIQNSALSFGLTFRLVPQVDPNATETIPE